MNRRSLILTGSAAAAAGFGLYAWQALRKPPATGGFWSLSLPQPDGTPLAMESFRGRPLLVNFWATWCPPCVREMPLLDRVVRQHAPWQLLGIAVDEQAAVQQFLQRTPVGFPIVLAGFAGVALARELGNAQGGLPYSVFFDAQGAVARQHAGELHEDQLLAWLR